MSLSLRAVLSVLALTCVASCAPTPSRLPIVSMSPVPSHRVLVPATFSVRYQYDWKADVLHAFTTLYSGQW